MNTPWGNARATYKARGMELPSRGSMGDKILVEMLSRERLEKLIAWEMSMLAQGYFTMGDPKAVTGIVEILREEYKEHLFQEAYTMRSTYRRLHKKLAKAKDTESRMEQLNKITKMKG